MSKQKRKNQLATLMAIVTDHLHYVMPTNVSTLFGIQVPVSVSPIARMILLISSQALSPMSKELRGNQ